MRLLRDNREVIMIKNVGFKDKLIKFSGSNRCQLYNKCFIMS